MILRFFGIGLTLVLVLAACDDVPAPSATPSHTLAAHTSSQTPDVWASLLDRPLKLPKVSPGQPCPRSHAESSKSDLKGALGSGPIYVFGFDKDGTTVWYTNWKPSDGRYQLGLGLWVNEPDYLGPAILRGGSIYGSVNTLSFMDPGDLHGQREVRLVQLPLDPRDLGAPHAGLREYWVTTWVSGPGCYAYQIDGIGFTEIIVVEMVMRAPDSAG